MNNHLQPKLRLLALLTALFMGFGTAQAAYDFSAQCGTGQTLYYRVTDWTNYYVSIVAPGSSSEWWPEGTVKPANMIAIPETVSYYGMDFTVTSIGDHAFYTCDGLTVLLQVPNTVTTIENYAFYGCSALRVANIPNSVTSIGSYAFRGCSSLTSVEIPNSVTSIGQQAFYWCSSLTSVEIPNSVTSIGQQTFYYCTGLTSVTIGNSVTSIGQQAFYLCRSLTSVEIPNSVTSIGQQTFYNCTGLTSVTIGNSVTSIGQQAFCLCRSLTSVEIPNSVTSIGQSAFSSCYSLTSVEIPNSVTSIGSEAFAYCSSLTSITSQATTPPTVGNDAFYNIPTNATVYVPCGSLEAYQSAQGWNGFTYYNELCIDFADANVKAICIANWDTDDDGELSYDEAAAVTDLGEVFRSKFTITSFDELQHFTGLTSIGQKAFQNCTGLTSVEIPNSVTSIGSSAFSGCTGLTSVEIPNSVTSIGQQTFQNCTGLTSVEIPNSVTSIGNYAFYGCSGLTSVEIPNSVTSIGSGAFYSCSGLTSVEIPNSVTSIGGSAFSYCTGLTSVEIPNSVTSIGNNPFSRCSGLATILVASGNTTYDSRNNCNAIVETATNTLVAGCKNTVIPNSVTSIGGSAFSGCTGLTSVEIPNSVTSIGGSAFSGCTGLTSVEIPNSVTSIGSSAFYGCSGLTSVEIPNSVTSIGQQTFYNCTGLTSITSQATTPPTVGNNAFYNVPTNATVYVPCGSLEAYQSAQGWNGFTYYNELCIIVFADANVKAICIANWDTDDDGELSYDEAAAVTDLGQVFRGNTTISSFDELQHFTGLTSIGGSAFYGCRGLTSVEIPNSVTSIGEAAFFYCSGLTSVEIPNSVTSIGDFAFNGCTGLATILVASGNTTYDSRNNCNAIVETATNTLVAGCKNTVIPNSVTSIGGYAFSGCTGLTSVEIPNSVTSIGSGAFYYCTGLTSVEIPNSVTYIGDYAFYGCSGLTSVEIPNSVTSIGQQAFSYCSGLTSVEIPNSVTSIGQQAFSYCTGLTTILVASGNTTYDSRNNCNAIVETATNTLVAGCKNTVIPNSVTSIGDYAFYGCSGLTSVEIPNSVTSIGQCAFSGCSGLTSVEIPNSVTSISIYAFDSCTGLTSVEIPNSVTSIGQDAFRGCSGLTSVEIPNSVTSIGGYAFADCTGLTSITSQATTPPGLKYGTFYNVPTNATFYVPYESLNNYKTASYWSSYASRIYPWLQKEISGYGEDEGKWKFIASPLTANTEPTAISNMVGTEYDLYRFNQSVELEWKNFKIEGFSIENGIGYLYANKDDVNIIFKGTFNEEETQEVNLVYDEGKDFAGWNLVGNPFPMQAYANRSYYTMNDEGTAIEPNAVSASTAIPACTGIMVKAETTGENVTFSKTAPSAATNNGALQIAVAQANTRGLAVQDKAIVSFNAGDELGKFYFGESNAKLYIPQNGKELAIATTARTGELPLNFKATKNGEYKLRISIDAAELEYLHLIDNLNGADVDLLQTNEYTFTAKTSDYASRFRLVFEAVGASVDAREPGFAFFNGSAWLIANEGEATLQVIDAMGRVLSSETISGNAEVNVNAAPGVYMFRLVNGENVKTQKVVVR